jgi:NAD(P)-dependent dehydrogenase (short-subunit alcohol dehydrogenase family)
MTGHAAVVTGAAGALGSAIAARLRADGLPVLGVDLVAGDEDAIVADLTEPAGAEAVAGALRARGWAPAVLVNNAGINRDARAADMTDAAFSAVVQVDLVAPARLAHALRPLMPDGAAVVNIASRAALGSFGQANYVAAKAGLVGLTRALALRWAPQVRVNAVAPGFVDTPMTAGMPEKVLSRLVARVPAGRMAEPAEIADTVAYLASPAASYVTGQLLVVCGGRSVAR